MAQKWEFFFLYLEFDLSETSKVCFGFIEFSIQNFVQELGELKERLELREQDFKKLTNESNELHRTNQSLKQ